jgi:hypothetical protein
MPGTGPGSRVICGVVLLVVRVVVGGALLRLGLGLRAI